MALQVSRVRLTIMLALSQKCIVICVRPVMLIASQPNAPLSHIIRTHILYSRSRYIMCADSSSHSSDSAICMRSPCPAWAKQYAINHVLVDKICHAICVYRNLFPYMPNQ